MPSPPSPKRHRATPNSKSPPQPTADPSTTPAFLSMAPPTVSPNPRKRRASQSSSADVAASSPVTETPGQTTSPTPATNSEAIGSSKKKARTNTPWSPAEEQQLKTMRDAGNNWGEIAKAFPTRTEGSVKKHWYKDMHYAEFAEDESQALREAIREYEANKWKVIGQKVGKPAKACEQYSKEHFKGL